VTQLSLVIPDELPREPTKAEIRNIERGLEAQRAAEVATATQPKRCRCEPRGIPWHGEDGAVSCVLCGRRVGSC
jgi:hypothetical protein